LLVLQAVVSFRALPRILELLREMEHLSLRWVPHFTSVIRDGGADLGKGVALWKVGEGKKFVWCIEVGENWQQAIDSHLNSADIILVLVNAYFLTSDYRYDVEMSRALGRHDSDDAVVMLYWYAMKQGLGVGCSCSFPSACSSGSQWPDG
jgi:hypothetical protein